MPESVIRHQFLPDIEQIASFLIYLPFPIDVDLQGRYRFHSDDSGIQSLYSEP